MKSKSIDIDTLVSITTGRMFTDFEALGDAVKWATGQTDDLATVGVALMGERAKTNILAQHPDLPTEMEGDVDGFVNRCRDRYGEVREIAAP